MYKSINLDKLDKSKWQSFTFEQIAKKITETVQPSEADVDIYVGLEHINPNDLHIRRKSNPSKVKGGKLRCYPGDVIFGKRRAYQRKAAIVDFEGICSAHAFVFRAISEVINPQLFPFFLHSDQFMHRMIDISVGGLSPTINWNDLKHQEFLLPPKFLQDELTELLISLDKKIEAERKFLNCLENVKKSLSAETFISNKMISLGDDKYFKILASGINKFENNKDYISTKCVQGFQINTTEGHISFDKRPSRANMQPVKSSLWFAKMKNTIKVIKPSKKDLKKYIFSTGFCGIKPNLELVDLDYLFHFFLSSKFNAIKDSLSSGTTQKSINKTGIESIKIPIKDLKTQVEESSKLNLMVDSIQLVCRNLERLEKLNKSIINKII